MNWLGGTKPLHERRVWGLKPSQSLVLMISRCWNGSQSRQGKMDANKFSVFRRSGTTNTKIYNCYWKTEEGKSTQSASSSFIQEIDAHIDLTQDKWFWPFEETMDSQEPRSQVLLKAPISSFFTPELDLFLSLGMSRSHLARTLSSDPNFFTGSLENQIITKFHAIMSK